MIIVKMGERKKLLCEDVEIEFVSFILSILRILKPFHTFSFLMLPNPFLQNKYNLSNLLCRL